jgi:hypothetical protein
MKVSNIEVHGLDAASRAMRNPLNSWEKGDRWGEDDRALLAKLVHAGPDHRKVLRLIQCWATVEAPRYWWTEFDTYKVGVTRMSCSTMYTICSRLLSMEDFAPGVVRMQVLELNCMIAEFQAANDHATRNELLRRIKANLPEGYIQRADVCMSYEALLNIYRGRRGHKLPEWQVFRSSFEELPLMDVILKETR